MTDFDSYPFASSESDADSSHESSDSEPHFQDSPESSEKSSPPQKKRHVESVVDHTSNEWNVAPTDNCETDSENLQESVYSMLFDSTCQHQNCEFSALENEITFHEKKCEYRMVPCPDDCCRKPGASRQSLVPLHSLLEHIKFGKEEHRFILIPQKPSVAATDGLDISDIGLHGNISTKKEQLLLDGAWPCSALQREDHVFLVKYMKRDEVFYAYVYIVGDLEDAKKFQATMVLSNSTRSLQFHKEQVFPIDARIDDILNQDDGVLSFRVTDRYWTKLFTEYQLQGQIRCKVQILVQIHQRDV